MRYPPTHRVSSADASISDADSNCFSAIRRVASSSVTLVSSTAVPLIMILGV